VKLPALENRFVRLEPLQRGHLDAMAAAATADRSTFGLAPVPRDRAETAGYIDRALADQQADRAVPFAIVRGGELVGSIRFMSFEWWSWPPGPIAVDGEPRTPPDAPDVVEIGHAWLVPAAQRTAVFTASCHLMMLQAFDDWRVHRLVLKTDARNQRSRDAIARLGAHFEGILRAHLPAADGVVRDTAMFSIVRAEWPAVRMRLESLLRTTDNP
jgi:RimJ/RimL family protein N-acetyltransferase